MMNTYASLSADLPSVLHGAARLHVALGKADGHSIATRGWTYNNLIDGVIAMSATADEALAQSRCLACVFDTLDAMTEIGPSAVAYLQGLAATSKED